MTHAATHYILNADIPDDWTFEALSAALAPRLAAIGVILVERPRESGLGGLVLGDEFPAEGDALAEQVRSIVDDVCVNG